MTTPPTNSNDFVYWIVGIFAVVVIFLFQKLYSQLIATSEECKIDRDVLREKIDEQSEKINNLESRTAKAELLSAIPCNIPECPKLTSLIKTKSDKVDNLNDKLNN